MKNKIVKTVIISICFFITCCTTVFAAGETVIRVDGPRTIKKGDKIEYKISVKDVNRLYAGSIDIKFNNENIIFKEIKASDFINKEGVDKIEFGGEPNTDNNKISYQFTCVGQVDGFSGEGVIATVIAEGIKDCEINFDNSLFIQLCERTESNDIVDIKYSYVQTDVISEINSKKVSEKAKTKNIDLSNESSGESIDENTNGEEDSTSDGNVKEGSIEILKDTEDSIDKDILQKAKNDSSSSEVLEEGSTTLNEGSTEGEEDSSNILFILVGVGLGLVVMGTVVYLKMWKNKK